MNAAMNYAKANRMTTLEMTMAGQNLIKLTQGMPWEQAVPMWQRLKENCDSEETIQAIKEIA